MRNASRKVSGLAEKAGTGREQSCDRLAGQPGISANFGLMGTRGGRWIVIVSGDCDSEEATRSRSNPAAQRRDRTWNASGAILKQEAESQFGRGPTHDRFGGRRAEGERKRSKNRDRIAGREGPRKRRDVHDT
jgi:hypothetical protein